MDNESKSLGEMEIDEESELITESSFDDRKPDGVEVEECSGNERWYNLAALVLWPAANRVAVKLDARSRCGFGRAVEKLEEDIKTCREQGLAVDSKEWQECQEMTRLVVKRLEKMEPLYLFGDRSAAIMLTNVQSCGDLQLYISYLAVVTKRKFSAEIANNLLLGCKHFGWPALHDALCAMLQHNTRNSKALGDCVLVVATLAAEGGPNIITDEQQLHTCRELATMVHSAVIACSTEAVPVSALFKLLYVTDQPQLLQEAARYVKTRPEQYQIVDKPQLPAMWYYTDRPKKAVENSLAAAVLKLSNWLGAKAQECRPFMELLEVCITALTAKTNAVIPDTWAVKFSFTPCCKDCRDLAQFLNNSSQEVGRFKVTGARRSHLQQKLIGVSASCVIERGSQTLVVTKTRPHLQHEKEQQKKDHQVLASLRALPAAASIALTTNGATASATLPGTHPTDLKKGPVVDPTHLKKGPVVDLTTA